jgi:uncharacterized protein YndB with AHSA1/START domain
MAHSTTTAPVRLSVSVAAAPERAFTVFTREMGSWWPLATHSVCEDPAATVIFEERAGGRVLERSPSGTEVSWAEVTVWEPPRRIVLAWRPNPEPGPRTEVEVDFVPEAGGTRVELIHRGWEKLGELAEDRRTEYASDRGWPMVLDEFVARFQAGANSG